MDQADQTPQARGLTNVEAAVEIAIAVEMGDWDRLLDILSRAQVSYGLDVEMLHEFAREVMGAE